ncbi:MCE family protein [Nocardioides marmoriginsengisoli]|uniref:MCE family protein n=1 Tax=Nocardioides marmoriginsengisoli TaxID=661483 RepID=A0A3N0CN91_9ACTN|nr:MlaD family protein [Nocardioides marmoriginsengisoli]RNL64810.1 MCE family protein [Nocardioides marmoriginsengisoli]
MTRGVKVRLIAFVVLAAVGIVYVTASYLGLMDKVTGRGLTLHAELPSSGGLFVGSEVTYRGVKVGKVSDMEVIPDGVRLTFAVKEGTRIPADSPFFIHNLSAVGEQYLDFEPKDGNGPYAADGDTFDGDEASLPQATDDLLVKINGLVGSLNQSDVATVTSELGTMFKGTADPLRRMVDSGTALVAQAKKNEAETIALIRSGQTVLETQQDNAANIRSFSSNLADFTGTLASSDDFLRTVLEAGTPAVQEVDSLLTGLKPILPSFLGNLVEVNQVATDRLNALEQTLVTFPAVISSGFTGTPGDGYGHINLQLNYAQAACTEGYKPVKDWRPGTDLTDSPTYQAKCLSPAPYNMRGSKYAPQPSSVTGNRSRVGTYDAEQARTTPEVSSGRHTVFGDDTWKWILLGSSD